MSDIILEIKALARRFRAFTAVDGLTFSVNALADRVVLSTDQRSLANRTLLRNKPQRGEDANLDCVGRLPHGGHHPQATGAHEKVAQNLPAFEYSPF